MGGARHYVDAITARIADKRLNSPVRTVVRDADGAHVHTDSGIERFDHVVLACHSDQALAMLGAGASAAEREVLGAIPYQANVAVLHTDSSVLPERRTAWAAWNYERAADADLEQAPRVLALLAQRFAALAGGAARGGLAQPSTRDRRTPRGRPLRVRAPGV